MHQHSLNLQWTGQDLRYYQNSIYGNLAVVQKEGQFTFFENGVPIVNVPVPDIALAEELVHFPMLFHPQPKKVLLISGGIGGVLTEILKYPIDKIDYTELDPLIIQAARQFTTPLTERELGDSRLNIHYIDGRLFTKKTTEKFDVVIVNLPPPSTLQLNRYYTAEFFELVKNILNDDGLFTVRCPGSIIRSRLPVTNLNFIVRCVRPMHLHPRN